VQNVKSQQGLMPYLVGSQHEEPDPVSNKGSVAHDRGSYGNTPISKLVPREKISRITQAERQDEKANTNDPVELPRRPVRPRIENPDHMKKDRHYHSMSGPAVQISQNLPIKDESQCLHVKIGSFDGRCVKEHKQNSCKGENQKKKAGNPSQAECERELEAMTFHLHWENVKEETVIHQHGPFQKGIRNSGPEDGTPNRGIRKPLEESLLHLLSFHDKLNINTRFP